MSMATHAARRLIDMSQNAAGVVGVELLAAAQGIDFQRPLKSSAPLEEAHSLIRDRVAHWSVDRFIAPDLAAASELVLAGACRRFANQLLPSEGVSIVPI